MKAILKFCDQQYHKEIWFRNRVIIEVLAYTGIRIGELEKINIEDVKDGYLYIRSEKMERDRLVPLPQGLQEDIKEYVEKYRMRSDPRALFTSEKGRMVQILVGHARIETTTIYEHITSKKAADKGRDAVERLFRDEGDLNQRVQKGAGAEQDRWAHWDLNPDLRVSLRVIAPVYHQHQMTHI